MLQRRHTLAKVLDFEDKFRDQGVIVHSLKVLPGRDHRVRIDGLNVLSDEALALADPALRVFPVIRHWSQEVDARAGIRERLDVRLETAV
jgi:hypothetical protein